MFKSFRGIFPALLTPFDHNGKVNTEGRFRFLCRRKHGGSVFTYR